MQTLPSVPPFHIDGFELHPDDYAVISEAARREHTDIREFLLLAAYEKARGMLGYPLGGVGPMGGPGSGQPGATGSGWP